MTRTKQRLDDRLHRLPRTLGACGFVLWLVMSAGVTIAEPPYGPAPANLLQNAAATRGDDPPAASAPQSAPQPLPDSVQGASAPATACARRYHTRLASEVLPLAALTQSTADSLRALRADAMPGSWLFWNGSGIAARTAHQQSLLAVPLVDTNANRLCTRQILARGGRIRCLQWEPLPPDYEPPTVKPTDVEPSKPEITPAERRIAARLSRRVTARGRFPEFDRNTAFYHIAQRTTDELLAYAGQPYRDVICSGALEMAGFYRRQLLPLRKRATQSAALHRLTLKTARETAAVAIGAASLPSDVEFDYSGTIRALLSPVLTSVELTAATAPEDPMKQLENARKYLTETRFDELPAEQREILRKALRNVEFAIYAGHEEMHLSRLTRAFDIALDEIKRIHRETCTCVAH